jgi:hypothetical protein
MKAAPRAAFVVRRPNAEVVELLVNDLFAVVGFMQGK